MLESRRDGEGWSGVCLRPSVSMSVGLRYSRAGVPSLQRPPATRTGTSAPSAPAAREPRPFPGSSVGALACPAWPGVGPRVSAGRGTRCLSQLARSLPLPALALCLWLPLAPVPFMKRGPITC